MLNRIFSNVQKIPRLRVASFSYNSKSFFLPEVDFFHKKSLEKKIIIWRQCVAMTVRKQPYRVLPGARLDKLIAEAPCTFEAVADAIQHKCPKAPGNAYLAHSSCKLWLRQLTAIILDHKLHKPFELPESLVPFWKQLQANSDAASVAILETAKNEEISQTTTRWATSSTPRIDSHADVIGLLVQRSFSLTHNPPVSVSLTDNSHLFARNMLLVGKDHQFPGGFSSVCGRVIRELLTVEALRKPGAVVIAAHSEGAAARLGGDTLYDFLCLFKCT
jgi:hypothetical protein